MGPGLIACYKTLLLSRYFQTLLLLDLGTGGAHGISRDNYLTTDTSAETHDTFKIEKKTTTKKQTIGII